MDSNPRSPVGTASFQTPFQNPATTNQLGSQNRILTIDKGWFPRPASKARSGRGSRRYPTIDGIMNLLNNMIGVRRR
jgi:hypothetical protein